MSNNRYDVHFIVALECEAKPLIKHFGFKRCTDETAYSVFRTDHMTLTVSGVGKLAAAGATAYTQGRYGSNQHAIWLNIGIAGHLNIEVGDCRIAHKITDFERTKHWYPSILFTTSNATAELLTVSEIETEYEQNYLYEMEASGFYSSACRFSSLELIHALKVVSDNQFSPAETLSRKAVSTLIAGQLNAIETLRNELVFIQQQRATNINLNISLFQSNWHFTTHQLMQLTKLLSQWNLLSTDTSPTIDQISHLQSSKQVIKWLSNEVSNLSINFN